MYVVFEEEEPHTFLLVLKLSSIEHKSSLQGYVVQIDSNLVVIILNTFSFCRHQFWMFENTAKSRCTRNICKVASSFHEHSVQKPVGPLSSPK